MRGSVTKSVAAWIFIACLALAENGYAATPVQKTPSNSARTPSCDGAPVYARTWLFQAHALILQQQGALNQSRCADKIVKALSRSALKAQCPECIPVYALVLNELADLKRKAADDSADINVKQDLLTDELNIRIDFNDYLLDSNSAQSIDSFFEKNFNSLGDVAEFTRAGLKFHNITLASSHPLSDKSVRAWIKAVRSCSAWDFKFSQDRAVADIAADYTTNRVCAHAAMEVHARLADGPVAHLDQMRRVAARDLPAPRSQPMQHGRSAP